MIVCYTAIDTFFNKGNLWLNVSNLKAFDTECWMAGREGRWRGVMFIWYPRHLARIVVRSVYFKSLRLCLKGSDMWILVQSRITIVYQLSLDIASEDDRCSFA